MRQRITRKLDQSSNWRYIDLYHQQGNGACYQYCGLSEDEAILVTVKVVTEIWMCIIEMDTVQQTTAGAKQNFNILALSDISTLTAAVLGLKKALGLLRRLVSRWLHTKSHLSQV